MLLCFLYSNAAILFTFENYVILNIWIGLLDSVPTFRQGNLALMVAGLMCAVHVCLMLMIYSSN